jgi:hypothetical protein
MAPMFTILHIMRKIFLFIGILLWFALVGCQEKTTETAQSMIPANIDDISFKKIDFTDTSDLFNDINISFIYPVAMPNHTGLIELQKNFIKQAFGEKYIDMEPSAIVESIAEEFRFDEPCSSYNSDIRYELFISDSVSFPISGFLQYTTNHYEFTCGAHGNGYSIGCVYNLADKKKIELKDIFNDDWEQGVTKLIIKEYLQYLDVKSLEDDGYADENAFIPSSDILWVKPNGIEFVYPVYEIAPYSAGPQTIFLPWKILKPYLNQKSVIYP